MKSNNLKSFGQQPQSYFVRQNSLQSLFSRQSISQMNKRQRINRKKNYPIGFQFHQCQSVNSLIRQSFNFKEGFIQQKINQKKQNYDGFNEPLLNSRSLTNFQSKRQQTIRSKKTKEIKTERNKNKNEIIVYPFNTKLKIRRVDDNPKILSNIIKKKFQILDKNQLYKYIERLMKRRKCK